MTTNIPIDPAMQKAAELRDTESRSTGRLFALKHGDCFVAADARGDIWGGLHEADGMFRNDTRVLSRFRLLVGGCVPELLGGSLSKDNVLFTANLTNRPLPRPGGHDTPEGVIHIERCRFLWDGCLYERIGLTNYGSRAAFVTLSLEFGADFRDIFEVRGLERSHRGFVKPVEIAERSALLRYRGLDHVLRTSSIAFSETPVTLTHERADFSMEIPRDKRLDLHIEVGAGPPETPSRERFRASAARARRAMRRVRRSGSMVYSSALFFDKWLERASSDLALLTTVLPTGPYPYAGIPWFSTAFGRDAIITALETLWLNPALARGVLSFLAKHQAQEESRFYQSAPGKIMHETRKGEVAELRELPFSRYYGGVDSTPLFVVLAGAYAEHTADMEFINDLWPALTAAMAWITNAGDSNHDGLVDYVVGEQPGLTNQGWKDSVDSIFHSDGTDPRGPISLVEVQGYAFAAFLAMAALCKRRGQAAASSHWRRRAERLRSRVERAFWMDDRDFYGLALDGDGRLCRVCGSNAGHLLYCGLPSQERAEKVKARLLSPAFNSGWGLRTLAVGEARYNPMSYHNGSVWPHDNALCVAGLARYGHKKAAVSLLNQAFEAAGHFDMQVPELFCGFPRAPAEPPIGYPVACLPQAWSAGSVFMILQACLGVRIDAWSREVHISHPVLPAGVERLAFRHIPVGPCSVNLTFQLIGGRVVAFTDQEEGPDAVRVLMQM